MITSTKTNKGISEFAQKLGDLVESRRNLKKESEQSRLDAELRDIVLNNVKNKVTNMLDSSKVYARYLKEVQKKNIDPYDAAEKITKSLK